MARVWLGHLEKKKKIERERERESDLGKTVQFSRLKSTKGDPKAEIKTNVELTEKVESARAVYPFRPSGWFQRGDSKMHKNPA